MTSAASRLGAQRDEMMREGLKAILATESDFEVVGKSESAETLLELVEKRRPDAPAPALHREGHRAVRPEAQHSSRRRRRGGALPAVAGPIIDRVRAGNGSSFGRPQRNESQTQIVRLLGEGFSNREIARRVHLSETTVKTHLSEIFRKLEVRNRVEAALFATREGWI